jgi:soluble lytic murein transglycosylase-like protein
MPAEFQGSAKSIAFSPLRAPDQTQAEQEQLNQRVQWMKEDNQSQIESRRGVAAGMAERNRLQINLQDQDLRTLAGMSKTLTDNLLEVQKDYRKNQFNIGFNQYWMGQGDPAEIKKYEENKATLAAVGSTTADAARKLAAEGAEPWAVSRLKQFSGDQKAGYLMAMTQDKGAGYGPWLDNLIATDDKTQIDLGNGRVLTPSDARKGGPEAEAVATWARAEYVRQNGLQGANLAMLNDKLIPFMREGEAKVMARVIDQANRERGGIESQETISVMISGLKTEPGLSFTEANRKLASVVNPETGQVYGLNGARKLLQKLIFDLVAAGKDEGINRDTVKAIMDHPDLDGKQTWGERFKGEWLGIDAAFDKAEQADLAQDRAQEDQSAEETANNFIKLGKQKGGFTEAEVNTFKDEWASAYGARPLPSAVANYVTKEKVQADLTRTIIKRRLGRGEIIDPEDTRGLDPEVVWEFRDEIKQHNEEIVKNPEVQSAFTTFESALKNQLTASSSLTSPHYTLEPAKQEAKRMYIEAYKTFLEGSSDKNPATARQKAYETVLDRITKGKDDPTSKFYLPKDDEGKGYINFIPKGNSAASYSQATKQAAAWRNLVAKKGSSEIFRTLLIPPEDVPYLAQIAKDPSLPAPPSVHVLTETLRSTGWRGSFWDVMDAQFGVAFPNQTFRKPDSVALIDSASSKEIRALFTNFPSARRTQRGFATMPWSKAKVPNGYGDLVEQAASKYGLDPALLAGLLKHESQWNPRAVSDSNAKGLGQFLDGTAKEQGISNPFDPKQSIFGAAKYLRQQIDAFGGNVELGLRAYNQGETGTKQFPNGMPGKDGEQARNYPGKVLREATVYGYGGVGMNREPLVHPSLRSRFSNPTLSTLASGKLTGPPGNKCVTAVLETMQANGLPNPDNTSKDPGNNPRGLATQLVKSHGWKPLPGLGTPQTITGGYGSFTANVINNSDYLFAVNNGMIPSGAIVFSTRHGSWNGTSTGSSGYDAAVARNGGRNLWNGQLHGPEIYSSGSKTRIVLIPSK